MQSSLNNAGLFLINTLFDLYLLILMVRIILAWAHADYYNPFTQIIIKLTKPVIDPLRKIIPNYAGIEFATLATIFIIEIIKFSLIGIITIGMPKHILGLVVLAGADIIKLLLNTFFYAILLQAILSWIQPGYSPTARILAQLTSPIMRPIQRIMPPISGFDLSPIPAMIILQLLIILLIGPLQAMGTQIAFG